MIRLTTIVIGSVMLFAGCGQGGFELADRVDAAETDSNVGTSEAKSQIVRALLEAIDEIKGESPEVKDELRRSLLAADDDLAQVLGDSGKQLILNANKKPAATILGKRADPSAKSEAAEAAENRRSENGGVHGLVCNGYPPTRRTTNRTNLRPP